MVSGRTLRKSSPRCHGRDFDCMSGAWIEHCKRHLGRFPPKILSILRDEPQILSMLTYAYHPMNFQTVQLPTLCCHKLIYKTRGPDPGSPLNPVPKRIRSTLKRSAGKADERTAATRVTLQGGHGHGFFLRTQDAKNVLDSTLCES